MKKVTSILNVLLVATALVCGSAASATAQASENEALEVIMTRTSVREYTDQVVEKEKVENILRAAMSAPTAYNRQPWFFMVVDEREVLDELAGVINPVLGRTGLGIVVCGDMSKLPEEGDFAREYWIQDCSAAAENALLAAHAQDLGAVWVTIYPQAPRIASTREILSLPEHIVPLNIISVGYPAAPAEPKDKWNPENIRYNSWE